MKILILGGDGYLGWPTAMHFSAKGYEVKVVDNYLRRLIAQQTNSEALNDTPNLKNRIKIFNDISNRKIEFAIGDCCDYEFLEHQIRSFEPDVVIHYAEQPSAPYSMMGYKEAKLTLNNNINVTFNLIHCVIKHCPKSHIIKLGTMGEYGTPNIDIEEGWLEIEHKGRTGKFLYPRQAGSLYHTTKVLDTDLIWFYARSNSILVTDLMQGPVYGLSTAECDLDERLLPNFHYDDIFGTVINRFLVQAVSNTPLTVYGKGGQTRGYLNIKDTLQCVELAMLNKVKPGELRILNQFTETFSVNEIAQKIQDAGNEIGINVKINNVKNPRKELENHYYNPVHSGFQKLGLKPNLLTKEVLIHMLKSVQKYANKIDVNKILPRVDWNQ